MVISPTSLEAMAWRDHLHARWQAAHSPAMAYEPTQVMEFEPAGGEGEEPHPADLPNLPSSPALAEPGVPAR